MFTVNGTDGRQERARAKARAARPAVQALSFGSYNVEGSGGDLYGVTVEGAEISCGCMAGQNDKPCYHAFAALRFHERLAATGAPVAAPRDPNLSILESDLFYIRRRAEDMGAEFDIMEDILRAVRSALRALGEYEVSLMPEVGEDAQAA